MSKFKKKTDAQRVSTYELDVKLIKIIEFSGWFFLLALIGFMGIWVIFDMILDISFIDFEINAMTFSFIVFTGTSAALSFGLASNIKRNKDKKRQLFIDWIIGEFLFCMFAIFAVSVYVW
ncbi:MAG: hypothetical protein GF317_03030 [Candidatus Lokiarchaeota archaeon]|nr:hypothetical protein [Candidatus Lokiarchaeota archaeon]MBD3198880.1 hypothetical protein [Candidatus Lokiarchaeota archaeon]